MAVERVTAWRSADGKLHDTKLEAAMHDVRREVEAALKPGCAQSSYAITDTLKLITTDPVIRGLAQEAMAAAVAVQEGLDG